MPGFDGQVLWCANMDFTDPTGINFNHPGNFTAAGQLAIGTGVAAPGQQISVGTLTAGTGVTITNGAGTITIATAGIVADSFVTDAGTATPAAGVLNILGGVSGIHTAGAGSTVTLSLSSIPNSSLTNSSITLSNGNNITISGSPVSLGGTATVNVSGTTQHAVQIGNASNSLTSIAVGSTGQVLQANTTADPTWSTATYPSTGGTNGTFLQSNGTNFVNSTALTNGQLWIGNTGNPPTAATLTQGANITITNAAGSITIAASSSSFTPYQKEYLTYTFFGGL